jgi:hypothetical protein
MDGSRRRTAPFSRCWLSCAHPSLGVTSFPRRSQTIRLPNCVGVDAAQTTLDVLLDKCAFCHARAEGRFCSAQEHFSQSDCSTSSPLGGKAC